MIDKQTAVNATIRVVDTLCFNKWIRAAWEGLPTREKQMLLESAASSVFNALNQTTSQPTDEHLG